MSKNNKKIQNTEEKDTETVAGRISAKEYSTLDEKEREAWQPIPPKYERIPKLCLITGVLFALSVIFYIIILSSEDFADFFNLYVSSFFRIVLAKITSILPFSIAELFLLTLPIITFLAIRYLLRYRCLTSRSSNIACLCILSVASLLLSGFVLCFSAGYQGKTLDRKLDLESEPVNVTELREAAEYLRDRVNELTLEIHYGADDLSVMPYRFKDMNHKLLDAYDTFCNDRDFILTFRSRLKPVMLSEAMSYTHITGVYTYFTGESNINVAFPDYTIPFTAAHELAHQRGIAREDEANMIAFLVCIGSDDPYIQYSAYLNVYEYVSSALYQADRDAFYEVHGELYTSVRKEQAAYSAFFSKYNDSVASKVTGTVNDAYLKSQGTAGRKSYGMVVDLTVAYLKQQNIISNQSSN